jgi:starch synthase (maltosyl-transferring)
VFREGHDAVAADVVVTRPDGTSLPFLRMAKGAAGTDRWSAPFEVDAEGLWSWHVEGWDDPLGTWWHDAPLKVDAGVDVDVMLEEGARLYAEASKSLPKQLTKADRLRVSGVADVLRDAARTPAERMTAATDPELVALLTAHPLRRLVTRSATRQTWVDRTQALYGAWYEFFPRSEGAAPDADGVLRSGTFRTAMERLPAVAEMGFDVVYLPPIHPVGKVNRKGPNSAQYPGGHPDDVGPDDPGSPWAIGSDEGGHDAVHPELGTIEDFDAFVARTRELGMEVALDLALQCAPDHPWATEHPEWFTTRADGTIAYAENPPKKYQDIYPINFDNDPGGPLRRGAARGAALDVARRPHLPRRQPAHQAAEFWEWLIAEVKSTEPDVLFLAEAFTRPAMMHALARVGFTQSYTYFTWRTGKAELEEYALELVEAADYMRPNFFVNTPDILHASLQYGGPPSSRSGRCWRRCCRRPTACTPATSSTSTWPSSPGRRSTSTPRSTSTGRATGRSPEKTLTPYLTMLNEFRRAHPATHWMRNLVFHDVDSPDVMCWSKQTGDDLVIVVLNLDPHGVREATVHLDMAALGMTPDERFTVTDALTGQAWEWGAHDYVRLDPFTEPAHVFAVTRSRS